MLSLFSQHIASCIICIPLDKNNVFTFTVNVKEIINGRFVCWLMKVFVVSTWLQRRVLVPNKHGMHFLILEGILNFLTLPFSICLPPIRFLFLLKAVTGCSWNNFCRMLLVWRMFQFLPTTAVRFSKSWFYLSINGMRFGCCSSWPFSCSRSSLTSLSTFPNCSSTSSWL